MAVQYEKVFKILGQISLHEHDTNIINNLYWHIKMYQYESLENIQRW